MKVISKYKQIIQNHLKNLVIDDEDSSISYRHSEVSSEYLMTFEDLYCLWEKDNESIFQINAPYIISFIQQYGKEISLSEYNALADVPLFIKLRFDGFNFDIYISCADEHGIINTYEGWCDCYDKYSKLIPDRFLEHSDIDGYENCQKLMSIGKKYAINDIWTLFPAISYCNDRHKELANDLYQGYLPSAEELCALYNHLDMINYIFKCLEYTELHFSDFWTSTEAGNGKVYVVNPDSIDELFASDRRYYWSLITFFRKFHIS